MNVDHSEFSQRLKELQGNLRDSEFSRLVDVPATTLKRYHSGSFPSVEIAARIATSCGVSLDWLVGSEANRVRIGHSSSENGEEVRKIIYNIAYAMANQASRRVKPDAFAEHFLGLFDYLMNLEDYDEKSAARVIEFGAEQLKRASGQGDQ